MFVVKPDPLPTAGYERPSTSSTLPSPYLPEPRRGRALAWLLAIAIVGSGAVAMARALDGDGAGDAGTTGSGQEQLDPGGPAVDLSVVTGVVHEVDAPDVPEPTNEALAQWAKDAYGDFDPRSWEGTGTALVPLPEGASSGIVAFAATGDEWTGVQGVTSDDRESGLYLLGAPGGYSGTTAYGLRTWEVPTAKLLVMADGPWTLTVLPVSAAPELPDAGSGDGVYLYGRGERSTTLRATGEHNLFVTQVTDEWGWDTLVNEIDSWTGPVDLRSGPAVVTVEFPGTWRFTGL